MHLFIFSNNTQLLTRLNFQSTSLQQFHSMAFNDPGYANAFFCDNFSSLQFTYSWFFILFLLFLISVF